MSRLRRIEIIEPSYHSLLLRESSVFAPKTLAFPCAGEDLDFSYALEILNPKPSPFEIFDSTIDLTQIERTPFCSSYKRIQHRVGSDINESELCLRRLCDRVSALESSYDQLVKDKLKKLDRKYTWTEETKDRKYTWITEIKGEHKKKKKDKKETKEKKGEKGVVKNYKWTAEIKAKGEDGIPIARTYTIKASKGDAGDSSGSEKEKEKKKKKEKKCKEGGKNTRTVKIEEVSDHGVCILKRAMAKRDNKKGKKKELSPLDAAIIIQMRFKAYLIRRSQVLRALRELAVAKAKLKELRGLFNNFAYRRHVSRDAEERQKFSEKIIVLLLTVDAIEGADIMVRSAKRSMLDELEAMLEVVDPQPVSKSLSMRRRTFDLPSGGIQKEIAAGVAKVVQMLDEEDDSNF